MTRQRAAKRFLDRKGDRRGQSATTSRTDFVIPALAASDVLRAMVNALGFPTTKLAIARDVVLAGVNDTQATFVFANSLGEAWESRVHVVDGPAGTYGTYTVVRWTLSDGVVIGWKEMERVGRRVGEIVIRIGGTITVRSRCGRTDDFQIMA